MTRVTHTPIDPDIAQVESWKRRPTGLNFQDELRSHLREAKMGVRGQFNTVGTAGELDTVQLARVDVPPHLATPWTIDLSAPNWAGIAAGQVVPADVFQLYAEVRFGLAGMESVAEVDWRQGARFEVSGSSASIQAQLPGTVHANPHGFPLRIGAAITPGRCRNVLPPTRTIYYGTILAEAGSLRLPVPRYAYRMQLQRRFVATGDNWILEWRRGNGTALLQSQAVSNNALRNQGDVMQWLIVPPEATFLGINVFGNSADWVVAIYQLQL